MKVDLESEEIASERVQILDAYLERTFCKQWRRYRKAFKDCQHDFSENSVHELRVETRRLLALVALFHALWWDERLAEIERRLKRLFKSFSRLRDTHVQLIFVQETQERFPELARFQKALAKRELRLTRRLGRRVGKFPARRLRKLARAVQKSCQRRRKACSSHRGDWSRLLRHINEAFMSVIELRDQVDPQDSATIHQVRVAFKKFRYLVELLQPLLPRVTVRQIEAMHDYQSMMGEVQDIETLQEALDKFVLRKKSRLGKYLNFRDYLRKRRTALVRSYLHQADGLARFWPPRAQNGRGLPPRRIVSTVATFPPAVITDN